MKIKNFVASVIVTTYNRPGHAERAIRALLSQSNIVGEIQIIVVDDSSTDNTWSVLQALNEQEPSLAIIRTPRNSGLSAARNAGAEVSRSELLLFLDDDIVVSSTYVSAHVHAHSMSSNCAFVGNLRMSRESVLESNLARYVDSRYLGRRSARALRNVNLNDLSPRNFGAGVSSIRRDAFSSVGGFPSAIRCYGSEDVYMGCLLKEAGVTLRFLEEAYAVHYDKVSVERYRLKMREAARESGANVLARFPWFSRETAYSLLEPITAGDPVALRIRKMAYSVVGWRPIAFVLDWWVVRTDKIRFLFCSWILRAVFASWHYFAVRESRLGVSSVPYSDG